jgi:hypothetical protein
MKPNIRFYARMLQIFKGDAVPDGVDHYASGLADLVSEASEGAVSRSEALRWLLTNRHGRALLTGLGGRTAKHEQKEFEMPTRKQVLTGLLKSHGGDVVRLAKAICAAGATDVSEAEFTGMVMAQSQFGRQPGETAEQSFARIFNAQNDDGIALRQATRIASGFAFSKGDRDLDGEECDDDDEREGGDDDGNAYQKLCEKAVELRKHHPALSEAQLFALAYQQNPSLAAKEARQNRPGFARRTR